MGMVRARVDKSELERWQALDAAAVLDALADHVKADRDFKLRQASGTERVHFSAAGRDWEFLLLGPKWFDTRMRRGGGGAIDLAMHVFGVTFTDTVKLIRQKGV